jgi:tetrahydromethanopterin S-methyltransferase subunit G
MQFLYVPKDDLQTAKKRIVKKMRKNAESEPKYAMTTDEAVDYDVFLSKLVDLNDRLYTLQVGLSEQGRDITPVLRGISPVVYQLLKETKKMNMSDYSSKNISDIQEQLDQFDDRLQNTMGNLRQSINMNTLSRDIRLFILKLLKDMDELSVLLDLKISKPVGFSSRKEDFPRGSGFMMSRHIM